VTTPELYLPSKRYEADAPAQLANDRALEIWARQIAQALVPPGTMVGYGGDTAPNGWLLADGAAVSRTTYAELFAVYGTKYGAGDGSTTFNLPNVKGRVLVGRDGAQTEFDVLGETGGVKTHALVIGEMPSHGHSAGNHSHGNDAHGHTANYYTEGADDYLGHRVSGRTLIGGNSSGHGGTSINIHNSGTIIPNEGGGGAHQNLQPYLVANVIIKT
jgi:microcystin-dependent protein